jgi:hypothetical protein
MTRFTVKKLREAARDVTSADLDYSELVDEAFDDVAVLIHRTFGLTRNEADLLLDDTKADAMVAFDRINSNDLVYLDDAIDTIAEYFNAATQIPAH